MIRDKLAAVGLIPKRSVWTVKDFLDSYVESRTDVKPGTVTMYGHTKRNLIYYFGADKPLRDITEGDADEWRLSLIRDGLAVNTVRRRVKYAKQFFGAAVRKNLIRKNPFGNLKGGTTGNPEKFYFVSREDSQKIIDACPDAQWRLLFALSRHAGLRCPSEHLALTWADVDWERGRMTVRSSKTEHHDGGSSRMVPIFPELLPCLREVFEQAEPGETSVITRYRGTNQNLRTQLCRIIRRAGLKPWPKLFQNLRSTRETELAEHWPLHVVCAWIGNSQAVAKRHYLQVTDEHFEQAAAADDEALQNPVQQAHAEPRTDAHGDGEPDDESAFFNSKHGDALVCAGYRSNGMGPEGFEPPTKRL